MSYSDFVTKQVNLFKAQFPADQGWQHYKLETGIFAGLPRLLDSNSSLVKRVDSVRGLRHEPEYTDQQDAPEHKVEQRGWIGTYELIWQGRPVVVRGLCRNDGGSVQTFLVAAKDFDTAHGLYKELLRFSGELMRNKPSPTVMSTSGPEYVLQPCAWDDVVLPSSMIEDLRAGVETFFKARDEYRRFGVPYKRGFIFSGPAGCGKTLMAKTIVYNMRLPAFLLTGQPSHDATAHSITWAFSNAAELAPSILLIEELEKFSESSYISTILNLMDGLSSMRGVLVIATTNHPEKIDPALLLRPSRFDRVWQFPLPDRAARLRLLQKRAGGYFPEDTLGEVASLSEGFSMAYVQEIFASALSFALRENRKMRGEDLLRSVEVLKQQIKAAPRVTDVLLAAEKRMGFNPV